MGRLHVSQARADGALAEMDVCEKGDDRWSSRLDRLRLLSRIEIAAGRLTMSALGHKRTLQQDHAMSALPPKADMCGAKRNVRFVPIADIRSTIRPLGQRGPAPLAEL